MNASASSSPSGSKKLKIFSIVTIVIGLLMSWLPLVGLVTGIVTVVVNLLAKKKGAFTKWIGVILAVIVLAISAYLNYLSFFEVSPESVNNAISNLKTVDVIPADVLDDHKKIAQTKKFREAAKEEIEQFNSFSKLCHFMVNLEQVDCRNDELKESFDAAVDRFFPDREALSSVKDVRALVDYLFGVSQFDDASFYCDDAMELAFDGVDAAFFDKMNAEEFIKYLSDVDTALQEHEGQKNEALTAMLLPQELLKDAFDKMGEAVSTGETGYYADRAEEYSGSSEWYDPLAKEKGIGEIGEYQTTIRYELYGDFMYRAESMYFWGTDPSDACNETKDSLTVFAQDEQWDIPEGSVLRSHLKGGEAYFVSSGRSFTVAVFNNGEAVITTSEGNTIILKNP